MGVVTTGTTDQPDVAPFAARVVLPIAATVAVVNLVLAAVDDAYWFDEVYMLAIGRNHLDWGSADQPPMAPALAAAMDWLAPDSVLVLRLPAVVATTGAVILVALIARELGGDRWAQGWAALAQATVMWGSLVGHFLTPYTLEPASWLLVLWLLVRWVRVRDDRLLPILGVAAGIAAQTKFQIVLLCAVLLLCIALAGPRALLRRPLLWVAVAIGAVLAAPTLVWQAAHDWPQLQMVDIVAGEAVDLYGGRPGIAVQLIIFAGVAGAVLLGYSLWLLFRTPEWRQYRFLAVTFVALYVLFVITEARPYYLAGLYGPMIAVGVVGLQRRREAGATKLRWAMWPVAVLSLTWAGIIAATSPTLTSHDIEHEIGAGTSASYGALTDDQRDTTALLAQSYILAAYLDGGSFELPPAYSLNRAYGYFPPPPEHLTSAMYIGSDPADLRDEFRTVQKVGAIGDDFGVWLLTGRMTPWEQMWDEKRTLTVG